ncbi:SigE family RNA polymerase sigma factor [Phytomonospora sp. NPDC050363]|uniref:RNA polymerase sigma factor n=1 Tax=Phytomonospora sp. NPDC050363 TaxID=3155642 RepID=UPI0033F74981
MTFAHPLATPSSAMVAKTAISYIPGSVPPLANRPRTGRGRMATAGPGVNSEHKPTGVSDVHVGERERMRSEAEFIALYDARFSDLSAQLYAYTSDSTEAQDLVQEAFLRAWQRWDKIGTYDDPIAWVRRVAWNLAMSRHRRLAVVRRFLAKSGPPEPHPGMSPDHVALVTALRKLPDKQRRALVLHYLADMPIAEIARETGAKEGTVKSWLHRGRTEMAKHLTEIEPGIEAGRERKETSRHG